jgi:hypoxanthine phosphoribosyltransferase
MARRKRELSQPRSLALGWAEIERDAAALAALLAARGRFAGIIAVTRGGLVPAALVARALDLRYIDTVCISSYRDRQRGAIEVLKPVAGDGAEMLLIDDLVDSGETARVLRAMLPRAHFATLYAKPQGRPLVDSCVREVSQDTWIVFPWEI